MVFDLFSPLIQNGRVDGRLLRALGIAGDDYRGSFDKVLDPAEGTAFDFYMEAPSGRRYFIDLKLSEAAFGSCPDDNLHRDKLERDYGPRLQGLVDPRWLEPAAFFANYELLRKISYLDRYTDSGLVFIFPKVNEGLMAADETIKKIVSKKLAPRTAILYVEYLLARILTAVDDDEALRAHFLTYAAKYPGGHTLHSTAREP